MAPHKTANRKGLKFVTLTVAFDDLDKLKEFVGLAFAFHEREVAVYQGDALDKEFGGRVPAGAYVVRHRGEKPDGFLA